MQPGGSLKGHQVPLCGGQSVPLNCFGIILGNSMPKMIELSQAKLQAGITLLRHLAPPLFDFHSVAAGVVARGITPRNDPLNSGCSPPFLGFLGVFAHTATGPKAEAEEKLSADVLALCFPLKTFRS